MARRSPINIFIHVIAIYLVSVTQVKSQQSTKHPGCMLNEEACIFPVDGAEFLIGGLFDLRVEVHRESGRPDNHQVTVQKDGQEPILASEFFGVEPVYGDEYTFEYAPDLKPDTGKIEVTSVGEVYYNVTFQEQGTYIISVSTDGSPVRAQYQVIEGTGKTATNVIFFIGDGMQQGMISGARLISRGQKHGFAQGQLHLDTMPNVGLQKTSGVDSIITDSANSASSFNTGHKTSVNAMGVYADTTADTLDDPKVETLAERAKRELGKCVGIVSTAEIEDATPAAAWAHTRRRSDKAVIVDQMLYGVANHSTYSNGLGLRAEVILGGGGRYFHAPDSLGGKDYYQQFRDAGYTVVHTKEELLANLQAEKVLGIFHEGNMNVWLDRNVFTDNTQAPINDDFPDGSGEPANDQPGLVDMTKAAIDILSKCENGFYLYVESASIDKQMHPMDVERALSELIELDDAIGVALDYAKSNGETLVLATGDHGHGFDVFGSVDTEIFDSGATDVDKRRSIGLYATAGLPTYVDRDGDHFPDNWRPRFTLAAGVNNFPTHSEDFQVSNTPRVPAVRQDGVYVNNPNDAPNGIPMSGNIHPAGSTGVHTLTDVSVFSYGPGSENLTGTFENTRIYFAMADALGLGTKASDPVETPPPSPPVSPNMVMEVKLKRTLVAGFLSSIPIYIMG